MGFTTGPAPNVIGNISLTAVLQIVCFVHLSMCIFILASVSSDKTIVVAGLEVSPMQQCATAAWFLIGIPVVIYAAVGAAFRVEHHLSAYMLYIFGTLLVVVFWAATFAAHGDACTTLDITDGLEHPSKPATFVCGVSNGMVLFWMVALASGIMWAMYLAWSMKVFIANRNELELLRLQEPWQISHTMEKDANY